MLARSARAFLVSLLGFGLALPTLTWGATTHRAKSQPKAKAAPTLIWRGDVATATGVFTNLAKAWERAGHGRIELQPFNTASGIDAVAAGTADLGGSARASSNAPEDRNLTFTPVAWDGLVLITQAANPATNLTLKQVRDIYFGRIHDWSEVGSAPAPIDLYAVASPKDGVEYSLRSFLFGRGTQAVAAPRLYVNTHMLEKGVELDEHSLAVDTLSDIAGKPKLKALSIDGVAPTPANVANGSYPLFTPLYLVTNPRSPKAAEIQAFLEFVQSDAGKAALRESLVLPYADGSELAQLDAPRRARIYADLGVVAPAEPAAPLAVAVAEGLPAAAASAASPAAAAAVADAQPAAAAIPSAPAASATYTVIKGDTLSKIAEQHSVLVSQLREWNHLKGDTLRLGQQLRLSAN